MMLSYSYRALFLTLLSALLIVPPSAKAAGDAPVPFVVQLTRSGDIEQRRVLLQIQKVLDDVGDDKVRFEVVAYEEGIQALVADNEKTAELLAVLNRRGVQFKACRISMRAWELTEKDFPLEVDFIPAGAPEVIRLQLKGYRYWRP